MIPSGSNTALKALIEHAAAFSSKDNETYVEALALPFVHLWPDGEIVCHDTPADIDLFDHYAGGGIAVEKFGRTELDAADLILDWERLKTFYVKVTRYTQDGVPLGQSEAIWVAVRTEKSWKLKLRIGAARIK